MQTYFAGNVNFPKPLTCGQKSERGPLARRVRQALRSLSSHGPGPKHRCAKATNCLYVRGSKATQCHPFLRSTQSQICQPSKDAWQPSPRCWASLGGLFIVPPLHQPRACQRAPWCLAPSSAQYHRGGHPRSTTKSPTQRAGLKSGLPIEGVSAKYHDLSISLVFLQFNVNFFLPVRASKILSCFHRCGTTGCRPGLIGHPVVIRSRPRSISMPLGSWSRRRAPVPPHNPNAAVPASRAACAP